MNHTFQHTLTSEHVHALATKLLLQLPFVEATSQQKATTFINILLYAASFRCSISQTCQILSEVPHPTTVRRNILKGLDSIEHLEQIVNRILASFLPKSYSARPRDVAIDLVELPYHGEVDDEHEDEVRRSKAKSGTTHFFTYATAYLILRGRRYTLAIFRVQKGESMESVLKKMLRAFKELNIQVLWYLLDRGFYSVKVIQLLLSHHTRFLIPAAKRGKKPEDGKLGTGTWVFASMKTSGWHRYTMRSQEKEEVSFDLAVVCRNFNGKWGRHERETLLYATNCKWKKKPDWVRERYRSRFGIESSYRQLKQVRIQTSTRNPLLRLLFVGLALVLRNIWVWLHQEVVAQRGGGHRGLRPRLLRLQSMLFWLLSEVLKAHPPRLKIDVSVCFQKALTEGSHMLNY